jgi:hypothetical protein
MSLDNTIFQPYLNPPVLNYYYKFKLLGMERNRIR